jgi:hypothetical protein
MMTITASFPECPALYFLVAGMMIEFFHEFADLVYVTAKFIPWAVYNYIVPDHHSQTFVAAV